MAPKIANFIDWMEAADAVLSAIYGIDMNDAGLDDERLRTHWSSGETPNEFVDWFGQKYDLITKREIGIERW